MLPIGQIMIREAGPSQQRYQSTFRSCSTASNCPRGEPRHGRQRRFVRSLAHVALLIWLDLTADWHVMARRDLAELVHALLTLGHNLAIGTAGIACPSSTDRNTPQEELSASRVDWKRLRRFGLYCGLLVSASAAPPST